MVRASAAAEDAAEPAAEVVEEDAPAARPAAAKDQVTRPSELLDAVLAGRVPTADDAGALPFLSATLKEAMRLYPPVAAMLTRRLTRDITVGGVREVAIQIEVWSDAVVEELAKATALSICDATVTKLRLPTAQDSLAAVGISPFDSGQSNWIPSIVAVAFRGRANCDVRCRVPARALVEYAGFIASMTATANIGGGGAAIAETIEAP